MEKLGVISGMFSFRVKRDVDNVNNVISNEWNVTRVARMVWEEFYCEKLFILRQKQFGALYTLINFANIKLLACFNFVPFHSFVSFSALQMQLNNAKNVDRYIFARIQGVKKNHSAYI